MGRLKYDKEKLDFVEEKASFTAILKKVLWFFVASLGLSLLYYVVFALFINTDEEKRMITENRAIQEEYDGLDAKVDRLENVVTDLQQRDMDIYNTIFSSNPPVSIYLDSDTSFLLHRDASEIIMLTKARLLMAETGLARCDTLFSKISDSLMVQDRNFTSIPSIVPVRGFSVVQTGASLGDKVHPFYKKVVHHSGIDLVMPAGSEVRASASGTVIEVSRSQKESGNRVALDHGNGYVTTYSHIGDIYVRRGQVVTQGATIANVGSTGTSFAPHLHYEVIRDGVFMDPINFFFAELTPSQYRQMILIAANTGQSLD